MSTARQPGVWTVWADYMATGEGRTLLTRIAYAMDEEEAKRGFERQFGDYFAMGCEAAPGVVRNRVTTYLLSAAALKLATCRAGNLNIFASAHVNFG